LGVAVFDAHFRGEVWLLSMHVYIHPDLNMTGNWRGPLQIGQGESTEPNGINGVPTPSRSVGEVFPSYLVTWGIGRNDFTLGPHY
jgi:hypothetical protein